jgi:thiamine transport system permease protein
MAQRAVAIAAGAVAATLALLTLGTAAVVLLHGNAGGLRLGPADIAAIRFTLLQAALSAVISTAVAIPLARAVTRQRFAGRQALITLLGAPFLLPVIVAILGLVAVFGRAGWLNQALVLLGAPAFDLYGLHGVVLAHVFLNMPLATRMILHGWQAIPAERLRLAAALDLPPSAIFRHLEWPMLRAVLPGALTAVFTICLTSFAVALTLGGGPGATTVELAIYQALRFDYDLGHAAGLAWVQFVLCTGAALLAWLLVPAGGFGAGLDRATWPLLQRGWRRVGDFTVIALAIVFLVLPLAMVIARGLPGLAALPPTVWPAAMRSVLIALPSALLATLAALSLALAVAGAGRRYGRWLDVAALLPLATSGLVLGTGLFLALQPVVPPTKLALPVTLLVNAALALPFVYRLLLPEAMALQRDYGRLTRSLNLTGPAQLVLIILPRLARPLGFGAGLAAALSLGDLGVIALFATEGQATLPLVISRLMGAYRMDAAAGAALMLVLIGLTLFMLLDWMGRRAAP